MSIAEKLTKINNIKQDIKAALEYKGLTVNDQFDTYAEQIRTLGAQGSESSDPFASIGYNRYEQMPWLNSQLAESQKVIDDWNYSTKLVGTNIYFYPVINTGNVTDMSDAFSGCTNLRSVGKLDTIKVTNMGSMFKGCVNLITIPEFATSKVTNMSYMFQNCSLLENIPTIDTSSVTSMAYMFDGCSSLKSVPLLNTSNVTSMSYMFNGCSSLPYAHINAYNTSNVTSMSNMFSNCSKLKQLSFAGCDLRKVTNWDNIVNYSNNLEVVDLTNTKISNGFKFSNFGKNMTFIYEGLDTSAMTDTSYLFTVPNNNNVDISNFNLSNVTDMSNTFSENTSDSIIVGNIDTSKVTNMERMFYICSNITNLDLTGLDVSKVTNMNNMFYNCAKLTNLNITGWDTSSLTSMVDTFSYCKKIDTLDLSSINISKVTNVLRLFQYCTTNSLILDGWNFSNVTTFDNWVSNQSSKNVSLKNVVANGNFRCPLATESIDLTGINTTKCTSFNLNGCKSPIIDVSSFNTSNFTTMLGMFDGCSNVTSLDLSNFDYNKVSSMQQMFNGCSSLESITMGGNNKVSTMYQMFQGCSKLTHIDLTHLKLDNVNNMGFMFYNCTSLKELKMGGNPANLNSSYTNNMFSNIKTNGVFKYNPEYDYKYIIERLPSTWKAEPLISISNCTDLTIEADDVSWGKTSTTIRYTAVVNGTNPVSGAYMTGVTITGEVQSSEFEQNLTDNVKTITISYTLEGRTATTTITQGAYAPWAINLNNQWQLSTDVANPNPTLYEGVYESFSNRGVNNSSSTCSITFTGYETFSIYVRSDGEPSYDYVTVLDLDSTTAIKKSFQGLSNSGTSIGAYTLVTFTDIDPTTTHTITIKYYKDSSSSSGTDRGYLLIPKNQ